GPRRSAVCRRRGLEGGATLSRCGEEMAQPDGRAGGGLARPAECHCQPALAAGADPTFAARSLAAARHAAVFHGGTHHCPGSGGTSAEPGVYLGRTRTAEAGGRRLDPAGPRLAEQSAALDAGQPAQWPLVAQRGSTGGRAPVALAALAL